MRTERQQSQHAAGVRARLAVVRRAVPGEPVAMTEMRAAADKAAAAAADLGRFVRATRCRQLADAVRALERTVETEVRVDAHQLRVLAIHLENRADMLEGKPL